MLWLVWKKANIIFRRIRTGDNALLLWFLGIIIIDIVFYGMLFYHWESSVNPDVNTVLDFLWYSFITMTTIGYGDIYPITPLGRIATIPFALISLSCFGGVISILGTKLITFHERQVKGLVELKIDNHIIVVDCGEDTRKKEVIAKIIDSLREDWETENWPVVIIAQGYDQLPDPLSNLSNVYFCQGLITASLPYERANIGQANAAIILSRSSEDAQIDDSISLAVLQRIKFLNPTIEVRAECANLEHESLFRAAGCDSVIDMRALESRIMAKSVVDPDIAPVILQMLNPGKGNTLHTLRQTSLDGATFGSVAAALEDDGKHVMTIGLSKGGKEQILNPDEETIIEVKDRLIILTEERPRWKGKEGLERRIIKLIKEDE